MLDGINPRFVEGREDGSGREHNTLYAGTAARGSSKNAEGALQKSSKE
jgi:hypothetical protein